MAQSDRRIVDTNVIVRHLVRDDPQQSAVAAQIMDTCGRGETTLLLLPIVLAECVYVLDSFYAHSREQIADALMDFIESPGIEITDIEIHLEALRLYAEKRLHFVDCVIAAHAKAAKMKVATFDKKLKKLGK